MRVLCDFAQVLVEQRTRTIDLAESLAAIGVAIALAGAVAITRVLASLLYELSLTDPVVLLALPLLPAAVALTATCLRARRATKSDPLSVLRSD